MVSRPKVFILKSKTTPFTSRFFETFTHAHFLHSIARLVYHLPCSAMSLIPQLQPNKPTQSRIDGIARGRLTVGPGYDTTPLARPGAKIGS